jgi:8-oxo-dGTP diphosphatase
VPEDRGSATGAVTGAARPVTDVAVGVVFRADGQVLVAQRLAGKPYAGWWEFPGGKFEPGEDAAAALARELEEELGIRVRESQPWVVREHVYEHAHVRLHFRRVVRWDGEVASREGQAWAWRAPGAVDVAPLLPAAIAPIAWLSLPPTYAISDAAALGRDRFLARLAACLEASPRPFGLLQLREPSLPADDFERLFRATLALAEPARLPLLVSSRHDRRYWEIAAERTGGGVHLTGRDLAAIEARPALARVGASCHGAAELTRAGAVGADFAVCGPVLATASHPGAPGMGWAGFESAVALTPVPVFALGGMRPADLPEAMRRGAHGVAMQRAAFAAG